MNQSNTVVLLPLVSKLLNAKGQFLGALWTRSMKTRKGIVANVTKTVRTVVQVGVNYDNREVVKEARADGTAPKVNAGLPWGQWEIFPYVISHKGEQYVRLYPVRNEDGTPRSCKTIYRLNGQRVNKAMVEAICPASEFSKGTPTECYTLNAKNLQQVKFSGIYNRGNAKTTVVSRPAPVAAPALVYAP